MKVFISWSGEQSRHIAEAFREFVGDVLQNSKPFCSSHDIDAGANWPDTLRQELKTTGFGVLCLTAENLVKPWILFEAGAISNALDKGIVCPYLYGLKTTDLQWPLAQFNANVCDPENPSGTHKVVRSINTAMGAAGLPLEFLERQFGRCWPHYQEALRTVPVVAEKRETAEPALDLQKALEEILAAVRKPSRHASISRSKRQRQVDYLLTFMGGPLGGHRLSSASSSQMERWLADSVVEATKTCKPGEQFALSKKLNEVEVYKYFGGHKYTHDNFMPFFGIREHWPTEDEYDAIYKVGPVAQWGEALHVSVHYVAALWPTGGIETWPVDNQQ